jgi:ribosomal protein S18 acetylase RimI-like enzyme
MLELIKGLALYERAAGQVTVSLDHFEESGFGERPVWWAFVAETEGEVRGFALYYIRYSTWKGQRLYLEDIYVEPEYRGRGIGSLLMGRLMAETKARGLHGMVWQALEWNEPALRFYRRYGAKFDREWVNCELL